MKCQGKCCNTVLSHRDGFPIDHFPFVTYYNFSLLLLWLFSGACCLHIHRLYMYCILSMMCMYALCLCLALCLIPILTLYRSNIHTLYLTDERFMWHRADITIWEYHKKPIWNNSTKHNGRQLLNSYFRFYIFHLPFAVMWNSLFPYITFFFWFSALRAANKIVDLLCSFLFTSIHIHNVLCMHLNSMHFWLQLAAVCPSMRQWSPEWP